MRRKASFNLKPDFYYFKVKMGYQNSITISRKEKREALLAYKGYVKQHKDCEWLGKWDGKKYSEDKISALT